MGLLAGALYGSTISSSWNGGSGNWSTAADWTLATVPDNGGGNTYGVTITNPIPYPNSPENVLLDTSPTINSLTLSGGPNPTYLTDSASSPQRLTINGPLTIGYDGNLSLNSSTVSAASLVLEPYKTSVSIGGGATLNLGKGITDIPNLHRWTSRGHSLPAVPAPSQALPASKAHLLLKTADSQPLLRTGAP